MKKIALLSSSVRQGALSPRVARFFKQYIQQNQLAEAYIVDLATYNFPLFEERLRLLDSPDPLIVDFAAKIQEADAVIIVCPEYNGGYPASLKNVIDLLYTEWKRKPIGMVPVSAGPFGGTQVLTSLLFHLWKIGATMVPAMFPVPNVQQYYDEHGLLLQDTEKIQKRATDFVSEILWYTQKLSNNSAS